MTQVVNDSEGSSADELQDPIVEAGTSRSQAQSPTRGNYTTQGSSRRSKGQAEVISDDEQEKLPKRDNNPSNRGSRGKSRAPVELPSECEKEESYVQSNSSWKKIYDSDEDHDGEKEAPAAQRIPLSRPSVQIRVSDIGDRSEYIPFDEKNTVESVLKETAGRGGRTQYVIKYQDGREGEISSDQLLLLTNGENALDIFNNESSEDDLISPPTKIRSREQSSMSESATGRSLRGRAKPNFAIAPDRDDDDPLTSQSGLQSKKRRLDSISSSRQKIGTRRSNRQTASRVESEEDVASDSESGQPQRPSQKPRLTRSSRTSRKPGHYKEIALEDMTLADEPSSDDDFVRVESDVLPKTTRASRRRGKSRASTTAKTTGKHPSNETSEDERPGPTRVSNRTTKAAQSMRERGLDEELYADADATPKESKITNVREVFKKLHAKSEFVKLHNVNCDVCGGYGSASSNKGSSPLIHCQGCTTSIHRNCLGNRNARDHRVTKIGDGDFVMQCRRCIGLAKTKDPCAPRLDMCQTCHEPGEACAPFSKKLTPKQEEKLREDNGGDDPATEVSPSLVNNAEKVLFRCVQCKRAYHFDHLPPLDVDAMSDTDHLSRDEAIEEYTENFQCNTCFDTEHKVQKLVAWRPVDVQDYDPEDTVDEVSFDDKEYLIKWESKSFLRCTWMPGAWVWGIIAPAMRRAFSRADEGANLEPKMTSDDAIPEDSYRMEIILDVRYTSHVSVRNADIDRARVKEVDLVYVKFLGLGYDEVVWENPPEESDTERWEDYVAAYNEYVAGKYFKQPQSGMLDRINKFRAMDFKSKVFMGKQPETMTGGEMMGYQMEGLNWLLYKFHEGKNVVLADEMGLGKTIQVIALLATLITLKPKIWPFLVVVPNSTCPNWRREIKKWAPSLRVVAYYGPKAARDMAMRYELYPDGCKDLRAHVVVTSFDTPTPSNGDPAFFRRIKWTGMIVDEGQRLKNDESELYGVLNSLKVGFKMILTGTPLQNNKRELFNLLQFLDSSINAASLDEEYAELTNENLPKLHDRIRPFFLRRTKAQVLKFLPPMAQVIIPVTMTVLQKKLYKSILAKNPELIQAIFGNGKGITRVKERGNLNNILGQLRKCLCHPFVYSEAIEERGLDPSISHRTMVDASQKLQLLEIMLPKLHERGHRVLFFSQYLGQLTIMEDFLNGLGLECTRLDGGVSTINKQKRIDAFNAPNSTLFAFLLSTRSGGVGINLATADTVIIMDPDFNPQVDIQAISRAHRLGQKKKVLVFQLMTKDSAEERIIQIGRKKMALDHLLIQKMETELEPTENDTINALKFSAKALFEDDDGDDIHYDSASVDKLLDRSQVENTNTGTDESTESSFSFARIWANDKGALTEDVGDPDSEETIPNPSVWEAILKQREADAAEEAAKRQQTFGRGKRQRTAVDYQATNADFDEAVGEQTPKGRKRRGPPLGDDDDGDFASAAGSDRDDETDPGEQIDLTEIVPGAKLAGKSLGTHSPTPGKPKKVDDFKRAKVEPLPYRDLSAYRHPDYAGNHSPSRPNELVSHCHACQQIHVTGQCPLRKAGIERCRLCGLAHYGGMYTCTKLRSEIEIRKMLDALKRSTESKEQVERTRRVLKFKMAEAIQRKKVDKRLDENTEPWRPQPDRSPYFPLINPTAHPSGQQFYTHPFPPPPSHESYQPPPHGYQQPPRFPGPANFPPPPEGYTGPVYIPPMVGNHGHGHPNHTVQAQNARPLQFTMETPGAPPSSKESQGLDVRQWQPGVPK